MDKVFESKMLAVRKGERVRVLFDMLMEAIGGTQAMTKGEFFEGIKECFDAEQAALIEIMPGMSPQELGKAKKKAKDEGGEGVEDSPKDPGQLELLPEDPSGVSVSN